MDEREELIKLLGEDGLKKLEYALAHPEEAKPHPRYSKND